MKKFITSCLQTSSYVDPKKNIDHILPLLKEAIKNKSDLICLPECVCCFTDLEDELNFYYDDFSFFINFLKDFADQNSVFILIGSIPFKKKKNKFFNRCLVIDSNGLIISKYDKINLFDVNLSKDEKYLESRLYDPGKKKVLSNLPWGKLGLSICYDLRFPLLYKNLAKKGAVFFSIPAAFTKTTGKAHWHSLIRTRAIENGCYVFAAAQCGLHENGRETFGHSLIVDPWGRILVEAKKKPSVITALIDTQKVFEFRKKMPSTTRYQF